MTSQNTEVHSPSSHWVSERVMAKTITAKLARDSATACLVAVSITAMCNQPPGKTTGAAPHDNNAASEKVTTLNMAADSLR